MRLKGKVCVVTAAGQGIGAATARAFAREGATVWATDVDAAKLEALDGVTGLQARKLDVLDMAALTAFAQEAGAVDALFNCAGFVHHGTVLDATDEQWRFAFDLNVRSMFWTIQAFLPGMLEKGKGSIINMSSAASSVKGAALRFIYGTTKAAVIGLTKSVAVDYVSKGIRCNAICPGTVQTPSLDERIAGLGGGADARQFFRNAPEPFRGDRVERLRGDPGGSGRRRHRRDPARQAPRRRNLRHRRYCREARFRASARRRSCLRFALARLRR